MLKHYLTVSFRNLWKYRGQTAISIIGLAVGFACFALGALWIRYEMTYDNFLPDAERVYAIKKKAPLSSGGYQRSTSYPLAGYLVATFPEIEAAVSAVPSYREADITIGDFKTKANLIMVDSTFMPFFGVRLLSGSMEFTIPESMKLAITQSKAQQLFGDEDPLGKEVEYYSRKFTICAVVSDMSKRSNFRFDLLQPFYGASRDPSQNWSISGGEYTLFKLHKGVDVKAFEEKLYAHKYEREGGQIAVQELSFTPLTKMHYIDSEGMLGSNLPGGGSSVRFTHIVIFAFAGLMVILCTLFNYLSLFISRFRIRRKEFALRTVCGSSGWSLFLLLATELVITLILSIVVEMCIVNYVLHPFQELSAVKMGLSEIYPETISYISVVMSILLLVFGLTVSILRRRSLNLAIRRRNNSLFRKISVVMQLIISIGFAFCTIVIIKQIYFLHNSADLGFSFKNRGSVLFYSKEADETEFLNRVKAIPEVNEALIGTAILPYSMIMTVGISDWEGKTEDQETVTLYKEDITNEYYRFYELRLVSGEMAKETSKGMNSVSTVRGTNLQSMSSGTEEDTEVLINETAAKAFGWDEPIGKTFNGQKVVGVIKDVCKLSPSIPVRPTYYQVAPQTPTTRWDDGTLRVSVIFKFREGSWDVVRKHIADIIATEYPDTQYSEISDTHEAYDHHLKSETSLLTLLEFISGVCILICIFGFVSVVSLSCEERRKEIAIRKINGATLLDILNIFFRENFLLLLIGALIAFPAGYYIMRGWLDKYIRQTPLEAWLYIAIFLSMALLIVLCVGYRVWRASVENPAEVVKENF